MKTQYAVLMEDPDFRRHLSVEALVAEASEVIASLMAEQKLSKADLARRLNKSRAWVTQLLSGKANMTVRTLAEVVYTLGAEVKLQTQPPSWTMSGRLLDVSRMQDTVHSTRSRWAYQQPPPVEQPTLRTA
jgi:transcriptional regulator with XRE-family HTH domain